MGDIWGVNVSPIIIIGNLFTCTNALAGFNALKGTKGVGGHKQVLFFTLIDNNIGGELHACVL